MASLVPRPTHKQKVGLLDFCVLAKESHFQAILKLLIYNTSHNYIMTCGQYSLAGTQIKLPDIFQLCVDLGMRL